MKNNLIYYNLYATYDRIANTIGLPFVAQNNDVALRKLKNLREDMEKEGLKELDDISVMYLGQFIMTPIKIKDTRGNVIGFEPVFTDLNNAYDLTNCFEKSIARETEEREIKIQEIGIQEKDKNIINNVFIEEEE